VPERAAKAVAGTKIRWAQAHAGSSPAARTMFKPPRFIAHPGFLGDRSIGVLGIAYTIEALTEPFLRSGQLVRVLEDWSPSFEGLFIIRVRAGTPLS
jgi:hypothetical protein